MNTHQSSRDSLWFSWAGVAFLIFLGITVFFLFTEHTAHTYGLLPWLFLLLCPLIHLFMHRGHGNSDDDGNDHSRHSHGGD